MRLTPVPLRDGDLIRRGRANGFTLTEAWSPPGKIPNHAHGSLSLTILLEGDFQERYQPIHRPQECQAGSLLVRPAGEFHSNHLGSHGGRTLSLEFESERLYFHDNALAAALLLTHRRERAFLDIGLAMAHELRYTDNATGLALESLSLELLARLVRVRESDGGTLIPLWLRRTLDSIHDRFRDQKLRVSTLAAEAGVHPVYFARMFRLTYRVTPGEYLRRLRLEWARQRVLDGSMSVACIALECGFADQSHLARAFRARFGQSPGQMRLTRAHVQDA